MTKNKVCVWTQTYSDRRSEIFNWREKDEYLKYFVSLFDGSFLSFHNSSALYTKNIIENYKAYKSIFSIDDVTYQQSLHYIVNLIKDNGYNKILFMQDDCFSIQRDFQYYKDLADYINNQDYEMINLTMESNENIKNGKEIFEGTTLYNTTNINLVEAGLCAWYFDDGPYVADIDLAISIYDSNYMQFNNIWDGEKYLNRKMSLLEIPRNVLNKRSFRNVNFIGPNDWNKENELRWLNKNFG
jgi:hypothetical protein